MKAALACLARFRERLSGLHPVGRARRCHECVPRRDECAGVPRARRAHAGPPDRRHQWPRGRHGSRSSASRTSCRRRSRPRLVIDIGGGSTEFIIGRGLRTRAARIAFDRLRRHDAALLPRRHDHRRGARRGRNGGARRNRSHRRRVRARRTGRRPMVRPAPRSRSPTSWSTMPFPAAASRRSDSPACAAA